MRGESVASIRVALKTWASDKDGRHLVLLGIEADGRTRYISLNIKVRKTQWSKKNHRVLASTHPNAKDLNAEIEKRLTDARRVLNKMVYDDATLTV
ncbi:MAG: Arm DNA-binding domain-containing protein, partial [Bacteroidetes bacterium]|nr:Arm DNA-binding domain-containing protein [Bacteroidota bacterium]